MKETPKTALPSIFISTGFLLITAGIATISTVKPLAVILMVLGIGVLFYSIILQLKAGKTRNKNKAVLVAVVAVTIALGAGYLVGRYLL